MQRLIIDARRFTRRSSPPPNAPLGTVSALADIRLDDAEVLSFAASDIQDCFHHFELPASLQAYFGVDPWPAKLLGVRRIGSTSVSGETLIYPLVRTAPTGCTWSMYWCQRAHELCLDSAALLGGASSCLGAAARGRDRTPFSGWGAGAGPRTASTVSPPASTRCVNLVYDDSNEVFGLDSKEVSRSFEALCASDADRGLPLQEKTGVTQQGEFLGVMIVGVKGRVRPSPKRIWRVKRAFEYLARRPRVSSDDVHLGTRPLSHASQDGFGVVESRREVSQIERHGQYREHRRFAEASAESFGPREPALREESDM